MTLSLLFALALSPAQVAHNREHALLIQALSHGILLDVVRAGGGTSSGGGGGVGPTIFNSPSQSIGVDSSNYLQVGNPAGMTLVTGGTARFGVYSGSAAISIINGIDLTWGASVTNPAANDLRIGRGGTDGSVRIYGGTVPTVSSGFGTSPSITAGGSNALFQVNVGTGGTATSGVVAFHGTWTNLPYCQATATTAQATPTGAVATTTQVTLATTTAWTSGSLINVFCASQ